MRRTWPRRRLSWLLASSSRKLLPTPFLSAADVKCRWSDSPQSSARSCMLVSVGVDKTQLWLSVCSGICWNCLTFYHTLPKLRKHKCCLSFVVCKRMDLPIKNGALMFLCRYHRFQARPLGRSKVRWAPGKEQWNVRATSVFFCLHFCSLDGALKSFYNIFLSSQCWWEAVLRVWE